MVKGECLWNLLNSFVWFYFYDGTHNSSELFRFKNEAEKPVTGREMRCKYIRRLPTVCDFRVLLMLFVGYFLTLGLIFMSLAPLTSGCRRYSQMRLAP